MALDNLDASIPLAAGQIQIGSPQQQNAMLAMQIRKQQLQQMQQSENALRALYGNPGNLDETGRPTANAMAGYSRVDPRGAIELQGHLAQNDERQFRAEAMRGKITEEHRKTGYEIGTDVLSTYETTLKESGDLKLANQRAVDRRAELLQQACREGSLPAACQNTFMPWDPVKWRAAKSGFEAANAKPMTQYQERELGMQDRRLALEQDKFHTETKAKEDTLAETAQHHRKTEDLAADKSKAGKAHPAREVGVVDKDGNVVERVAANEVTKPDGPSDWFRAGTQELVKIPEGGHLDVGQAAGVVMGSREAQMLQRQLGSGVQALKALKDIVALPSDVSSGIFAGRGQEKGLFNAAKETLTNTVTSQDVQSYNAITPGITRSLAFIDSQGLAPGQHFTDSFNAEMLKEGDSIQTKMLKLARQREIVEGGMETLLTNPRLAAEQKKKAEEILSQIKGAIPWTPIDVIELMRSNDPKATLSDVSRRELEGGKGFDMSAPAKKGEAPPPDAFKGLPPNAKLTNEHGESYRLEGGKVVKAN